MKDRIKAIMNSKGMSQVEFSNATGIIQSTLSGVLNGRTKPSTAQIQGVHNAFPDISINWLLFGEGDMYGDMHPEGLHAESRSGGMVEEPHTAEQRSGQSFGGGVEVMPSMFSEEDFTPSAKPVPQPERPQHAAVLPPVRTQTPPRTDNSVKSVNIIDKPTRKIKEIRVFFDDGTYEAFVPSSK